MFDTCTVKSLIFKKKKASVLYIVLNCNKDLFSVQEMTRLNMEAAAMCLISVVDDLVVGESVERSKWLEDINPAAMKLKSFLEIVYQKILLIVMFLNIKVWLMCFYKKNPLSHLHKYKINVTFKLYICVIMLCLVGKPW